MEKVKMFVLGRTVALVTDWSKQGIRFMFLQKVCMNAGAPLSCLTAVLDGAKVQGETH